ncbi:MAG: hypothetical protein LBS76_02520 [Mycoplasmataceae bacterium]|jgi:hypothetical protein|nr:hypothetical protein [Mycoplasmataceae bacterium]
MDIKKFQKEKLSETHITFQLPKRLKLKFRTWCKNNHLRTSEVMRTLLVDHLEKVNQENGNKQ